MEDGNTNSDPSINAKMEFAVEMRSVCCADKVRNVLEGLEGVKSVDVDAGRQRLLVEGQVLADTVRELVETQTGMATVLLGHGSARNLGAGVAAISIGQSGVKGLLRFVQADPDTCFIEGTIDKLPTSEPIFVAVHETGDVSDECNTCGSLFRSMGYSQDVNKSFGGILKQLTPDKNRRAEFRVAMHNLQLADIIGHCVVVHQGDQQQVETGGSRRLACGIVARSSGLFQNSKRFCACDGVTIWDQRQRELESGKL